MTQSTSTYLEGQRVSQVVLPNTRDIGDFEVRRALPTAKRRMVGPFAFLDSFGPVVISAGKGVDSRPHPHIGLATITYLIDGELVHRDSEQYVQTIRAGEVNLMTAGRGIVHSERSGPDWRAKGGRLFGFQSWLALPLTLEETLPDFQHVEASRIPVMEEDGATIRLLAGSFGAQTAPTRIFSDTLYADVSLAHGARLKIDTAHVERALYIIFGVIAVVGEMQTYGNDQLIVLKPGAEVVVTATGNARMIMLGGEPLEGERHIYWNFVSSRQERVDQAVEDWRAGRFGIVPGEHEFVPLPD